MAAIVAVAITALLAALVLAPMLGSSDEEPRVPQVGAAFGALQQDAPPPTATAEAPTSTPAQTSRVRRPSPTAEPTEPAKRAVVDQDDPDETPTRRPARPTKTPEPTATTAPTATFEPEPAPALYLAEAGNGLDDWSGAGWTFNGNLLVNNGATVTGQRWLAAPRRAEIAGAYAIEAEIRVDGVAPGYCQQNFGVVAPTGGETYVGGGWLYPCDGGNPLARITEVTDWSNGYFDDPRFAGARMPVASGWHTIRIEVMPGSIRLVIDGELVAETFDVIVANADSDRVEIGVWSEGVRLSVRRIVIEPLVAEAALD